MSKQVVVARIPNCDLCAQKGTATRAVYDAKTIMGPWANMCEDHFIMAGIQLGTGYGQRLVLATATGESK